MEAEAIIDIGTEVRIIDGIPQSYHEQFKEFMHIEQRFLWQYIGKVGTVTFIDGCEEMPFIVTFDGPPTVLPFMTFRFRPEEIGEL